MGDKTDETLEDLIAGAEQLSHIAASAARDAAAAWQRLEERVPAWMRGTVRVRRNAAGAAAQQLAQNASSPDND